MYKFYNEKDELCAISTRMMKKYPRFEVVDRVEMPVRLSRLEKLEKALVEKGIVTTIDIEKQVP